jgi:hypothetical protein
LIADRYGHQTANDTSAPTLLLGDADGDAVGGDPAASNRRIGAARLTRASASARRRRRTAYGLFDILIDAVFDVLNRQPMCRIEPDFYQLSLSLQFDLPVPAAGGFRFVPSMLGGLDRLRPGPRCAACADRRRRAAETRRRSPRPRAGR